MNIFEWTTQTALSPDNLNEMQNILNNNMTNNFQTKGTILWTNQNPTSSFGSQTITLSSDDYDVLEIFCAIGTEVNDAIVSGKGMKGRNIIVNCLAPTATVSPMRTRRFNYSSDTSISVETAYYGTNSLSTTSNNYIIPLYVVGYKTGLFG